VQDFQCHNPRNPPGRASRPLSSGRRPRPSRRDPDLYSIRTPFYRSGRWFSLALRHSQGHVGRRGGSRFGINMEHLPYAFLRGVQEWAFPSGGHD
jgi:hypothetical protein